MGKRIVGTYPSEQEAIYAINHLKDQGYRPTDITAMAQNRSVIPTVAASTGARVESSQPATTLSGAMMDSFFTLMTGGMVSTYNGLTEKFQEMGLP
jgi:hypothetical protein